MSQETVEAGSGSARNKNLSEKVISYEPLVREIASEGGIESEVPYLLAIMQVESRGEGNDPMQSSESAGLPPNGISGPEWSIRQGIKYYKSIYDMAVGVGMQENKKAICQAYNFGASYVTWLPRNGGNHSIEVAEEYSKNVVAPSLGNTSGATYSYVNDVSKEAGKTYLYTNGGNFLYGELVFQFIAYSEGDRLPSGSIEGGEFIYPLPSKKASVSGFEWRTNPVTGTTEFHKGLDFAENTGTPIYASEDGVVMRASDIGDGYGINVVIRHTNGYWTRYAHMNVVKVRVGSRVSAGEVVGLVGSTGQSTGPHLHYEVLTGMYEGHVDPRPWIGIK